VRRSAGYPPWIPVANSAMVAYPDQLRGKQQGLGTVPKQSMLDACVCVSVGFLSMIDAVSGHASRCVRRAPFELSCEGCLHYQVCRSHRSSKSVYVCVGFRCSLLYQVMRVDVCAACRSSSRAKGPKKIQLGNQQCRLLFI
jgi:hypothetical protein